MRSFSFGHSPVLLCVIQFFCTTKKVLVHIDDVLFSLNILKKQINFLFTGIQWKCETQIEKIETNVYFIESKLRETNGKLQGKVVSFRIWIGNGSNFGWLGAGRRGRQCRLFNFCLKFGYPIVMTSTHAFY